jgi:nucleoid-associated protein YgaU
VLAAWALLAVLVVGVPLLLAYLIGWPLTGVHLPHGLPRHPATLHTLARIGAVLGWMVWAQFTACVIVEVRAARAGGRAPFRVPGISASRALAHTLVAVAFTTALSAAAVPAAIARPVAVASATAGTVPSVASASGSVGLNGAANVSGMNVSGVNVSGVNVNGVNVNGGAGLNGTALTGGTGPQGGGGFGGRASSAQSAYSPLAPAGTHGYAVAGPRLGENRLLDDPVVSPAANGIKYYVVQPPAGRHHDSLWDIAQRYLGDGRRYREIFALNQGRLQPDGTELQQESLIRPGWVLALPADASGPGLTEQIGSPASSAPVSAPTQPSNGSSAAGGAPNAYAMPGSATPGSANGTAQAGGANGAVGNAAGAPTAGAAGQNSNTLPHPVGSRPATVQHEPAGRHTPGDGSVLHSIADVLPYVALIGSPVLAAALLTALTAASRRRRRDHPGDPAPAPPEPAVAEVERTIRAAAATDAVDLLDRALRELRAACEEAGRTPPAVRGGRIDREALHLMLDEPDSQAPEPWTASADGRQWRFPRTALAALDSTPANPAVSPVPYPLLLCVGALGDEQILVNLEAANGRCTAVTGPPRQRRAVLAAAAATLAASPWADQIRIEAVGLPAELTLLAPERLRVHPALDAALSALEHDAAATGPHLVRLLIAENVQATELVRLRELTDSPDGSTTAMVGAERPIPDVSALGVDPVGRLRGPGLPGELAASRLPDALASALGALFRAAVAPRPSLTSLRPSDALLPSRPEAGAAPGIRASVLGPVELTGAGPADAARGPLFTEALVLLLFHRAGLPAPVFARALWPRGITPAARDRMLRDMRAWLGDGPDGPRLVTSAEGVVRLSSDVRSDWDEFQLAYRDADRVPADRPDLVDAALSRALGLVRGELLADRPPGRYSWLGFGTQETEVPAVVADAAYRLASVRLAQGDAVGAEQAAEMGLLGAPDDERLVQIRLRGIAAEGDRERLESVVADLKVRAWHRYGETELHPVTEAMAERLAEEMH